MGQQVTSAKRRLRVVLLWNEGIVDEHELDEPQPVVLGSEHGAMFPLPDGVGSGEPVTVLEPRGNGYQLRLGPSMGGSVWLGGERRQVAELARETSAQPLRPDDYGVVTIGPVGLFFQHVGAASPPARRFFALDGELAAGIGLSAFVFSALLLLAFLDRWERPAEDPLELPADLVAKYMVVPPPEDVMEQAERSSGTETEDPGLRGREETGGKRHEGPEGRVGREDARREQTDIAGEVREQISADVRDKGLLGALSSGNAISNALEVPKVSDILGGMGAATTRPGRGSAGAGLRGTGSGGGGDGPGSLFGAGDVGTGIGPGSGGIGRGQGGPGAKGRKAKERKITVKRGTANTNGYLSPEQINRVVRAHQAAIRYCYESEVQRQPDLKGRIVINWRINLQGSVTSARVAKSTMNNSRVEGCIVRQVRRWQFPKPDGGECVVNYPFMFGVQGG